MDKKMMSVSQQQFCTAAADVLPNQESGEKYLKIQFEAIASRKLSFLLQ